MTTELKKTITGILKGMDVKITFADKTEIFLKANECEYGWTYSGKGADGKITTKSDDNTIVYFAEFHTEKPLAQRFAITFDSEFEENDELVVSSLDYGSAFWLYHYFPKKTSEFPYNVSNMLVHRGNLHYNLTMLLGSECRTEWDMNGLHLSPGIDTLCDVSGSFLAVCADEDPYKAIDICYDSASVLGGIRVPLVENRPLPRLFRGFGYCTWNTFYQQPTSEGIYKKLEEFKSKKVPVQWMILDDGWVSLNENEQLTSFEENREKFPEGLKECIRKIKEDYGVKYVGIWHTLNFWWFGIDPESDLAKKYADCLTWSKFVPGRETLKRMLIPSDDPEKAFRIWDDWHTYLEECGVDFVKVDNQSNSFYYLGGCVPASSGTRHLHEAIERSIEKHFGGIAIDCMGMESANALSRPYTAVTRNSDDFFPDKEDGFFKHLTQNAYNALWHSQIYHCDYDMWWSGKSNPVESGLLRAISGGPVYVSDAMGETNAENIFPICGTDGRLDLFDHAAMPTRDEIYSDGVSEGRPFKVYNNYIECPALAVFNTTVGQVTDSFRFGVIPDMDSDKEYVAYEYFTQRFSRVNAGTECKVSLDKGETRAYSLFPIEKDELGEYIMFGDITRYFPAASRHKTRIALCEIGL